MAKATKKQALGRGLSALLKDPGNDIKSVQDKNEMPSPKSEISMIVNKFKDGLIQKNSDITLSMQAFNQNTK